MTPKPPSSDPILDKLEDILVVLQNLLIIEGARAGIKRDNLRPLVGVSNERLSAVMRHLHPAKNLPDDV
jgi:hypothetical protein